MTRTAQTLQSVTFYVALETTEEIYEYTVTAEDFLDNTQIQQADGNMFYTSIGKDYRKIYLINNFELGNKTYGSPIGICFTYKNGEQEWITKVDKQSSNAKNLNTMIGNWMKGLSYKTWKSNINYKGHPYIGKAENSIIVYMGYIGTDTGATDPPIVEEKPDPPAEEPGKPPKPPKPPKPIKPGDIEKPGDLPPVFTFTASDDLIIEPRLANKIMRNARYRGPRESYKHVMDTEEFRYDIYLLHHMMGYLEQQHKEIQHNFEMHADISTAQAPIYRVPDFISQYFAVIAGLAGTLTPKEELMDAIRESKERIRTVKEVIDNYE